MDCHLSGNRTKTSAVKGEYNLARKCCMIQETFYLRIPKMPAYTYLHVYLLLMNKIHYENM